MPEDPGYFWPSNPALRQRVSVVETGPGGGWRVVTDAGERRLYFDAHESWSQIRDRLQDPDFGQRRQRCRELTSPRPTGYLPLSR
ncbi:MAG: hypothetical protein HQ481_01135 [Alphaproteobacteria bacterium]|nr:hypothetical protein [Alphaproteobacteria bacterium]